MVEFIGWIRKVADEDAKKVARSRQTFFQYQAQQPLNNNYIVQLSADKTQAMLPNGTINSVVLSGSPAPTDLGIDLTNGVTYVANNRARLMSQDPSGTGYALWFSSDNTQIFVQNIDSPSLYYLPVAENGIDLTTIAALPATRFVSALISPNGRDIAVAYFLPALYNPSPTPFPQQIQWITFTNFSLNSVTNSVDSTVASGTVAVSSSILGTSAIPLNPSTGFDGNVTETIVFSAPLTGDGLGSITWDYVDCTNEVIMALGDCTTLFGRVENWSGSIAFSSNVNNFGFIFSYNDEHKRSQLDFVCDFSLFSSSYFICKNTLYKLCGYPNFPNISTCNSDPSVTNSFSSCGSYTGTLDSESPVTFSLSEGIPAIPPNIFLGSEDPRSITSIVNSATVNGIASIEDISGTQSITSQSTGQDNTDNQYQWIPYSSVVVDPVVGGTETITISSVQRGTVSNPSTGLQYLFHPLLLTENDNNEAAFKSFSGISTAQWQQAGDINLMEPYTNAPGSVVGPTNAPLVFYTDTHQFTSIPTSLLPSGALYTKPLDSETALTYGINPTDSTKNFINQYIYNSSLPGYALSVDIPGVVPASGYNLIDWGIQS